MKELVLKQRKIPKFLHDIFGESQSLGIIASIVGFGVVATIAVASTYPHMFESLPLWQTLLALLFIFDIFAGSVANFTASTSNYYAEREKNRYIFIAIHFHILLVAALLENGMATALVTWAYTIAGAFIVNSLIGKQSQTYVAGLLLCAGTIGLLLLGSNTTPYISVVSLLFMIKVLFSFAVDHYGKHTTRAIQI